MKFETKKRIVILALGMFTAWPLVHHGLVRTLGLNPWKWGGWAMYTTPPPRLRASLVAPSTGRPVDISSLDPRATAALRGTYTRWSNLRMELGALVPPDELARAVLLAFPEMDAVAITLQPVRLIRETAMVEPIRAGEERFTYRRVELFGPGD